MSRDPLDATPKMGRDMRRRMAARDPMSRDPEPPLTLRAAQREIVRDWLDVGYETGRMEYDELLDRLASLPVGDDTPSLDVERLMVAVFNADNPGDWPKWVDYISAFGSAGTPPWRRKAEKIAAEYDRLAPR